MASAFKSIMAKKIGDDEEMPALKPSVVKEENVEEVEETILAKYKKKARDLDE